MPAPELQSVVNVQTYADGHAAISIAGENGTLTLETYPDEPLVSITDPKRPGRVKAVAGLLGNGHLRGWFVEKTDEGTDADKLVWFPARKKRRTKKRPPKT